MKKNFCLLSIPLLVLALVSCGAQEQHEHQYVLHEELFPTCCEEGHEEYYSCDGCGKYFNSDYQEIEEPVATPIDPNAHKGEKMFEIVSGSYKTAYEVGESFDLENARFVVRCEYCEGSELSADKKDKIAVTYPTAGEDKFVVGDLAKEHLYITFAYSTFEIQAEVTLSKKTNSIVGLPEELNRTCGFKPFTSFEGVSSAFGEIEYKFADSIDGEYKTAAELGDEYIFENIEVGAETYTSYFIKASVDAGEDYLDAEAICELKVSHNGEEWNYDNEEYDVFGCVCKEPIKYNKKIADNQDLDLSLASVVISLNGSSYLDSRDTVQGITYVSGQDNSFDLGTDLSNLSVSALATQYSDLGEGEIQVVVHQGAMSEGAPESNHTIVAPVTMVTKLISTPNEFETNCFPEINQKIYGYFKQTTDLSFPNESVAWVSAWDQTKFCGTYDGNNKSVQKYGNTQGGLFFGLEDATIKNLSVTDMFHGKWNNTCILARAISTTTLTNVDITCAGGESIVGGNGTTSVTVNAGWVSTSKFMANALVDCDFDVGDRTLTCLFGAADANFSDSTFENCTVKASTMNSLYRSQTTQYFCSNQIDMSVDGGRVAKYCEGILLNPAA